MNKLLFLAAPVLAALIAPTDATAQSAGRAVKPNLPPRAVLKHIDAKPVPVTTLTGKVSVTAAPEQLVLPGFTCGNIELDAVSTDTVVRPSDKYNVPKWIVSTRATGDFNSHSCTFSLQVPGGQSFNLLVNAAGSFNCSYGPMINAFGTSFSGPAGEAVTGSITIPLGQSKTVNFNVTDVSCCPG